DYSKELWTTNGTAAGTRFVREISPSRATPVEGPWVAAGGLVFFAVNDGVVGNELWATDGTAEGTRLVTDICPGPCNGVGILYGAVLDGRLYFSAQSRDGLSEIWRSDGTSRGTYSRAVPFPGFPRATVSRAVLFFAAYEPSHGIELWQTDGTTEGTRLVADIQNGPGSGLPAGFRRGFNFGDRIFFTASDGLSGEELWAYRPR